MQENVIVTKALTKRFGEKLAVNGVDMTVRRGDIYGFIGRNGAGKTTAMKMILSLLTPTDGEVFLFGQKITSESLRKVGSLIESPGIYGGATAYENLKRMCILTGADEKQIDTLLDFVGLSAFKNKKARTFSLGMKQRLGIAIALIGEPEILILDEPINGLDPQGIKEVRDLIVRVNKEKNVTFLISSHLLSELEKIATVYGIIDKGVLLEEVSAEELEKRFAKNLHIVCDDYEKAKAVVSETFGVTALIDETGLSVAKFAEKAAEVNAALVSAGVMVKQLHSSGMDFESYFIERTGDEI